MKNTNKTCSEKGIYTYKRFNFVSFLISLNYFITPLILLVIIIKVLNYRPIFIPNVVENEKAEKAFITLISNITMFLSMVIALILSKRRSDSISSEKSTFSLKRLILLGIGLGVFTILSVFTVSMVYELIGLNATSKNSEVVLNYIKQNKFMLLNVIFVASIGEEIAFKYGIFTFFHELFNGKSKFWEIVLPAFISAFIFAIIHDGLYLLPTYFIPSFVGCLIYKKTRSLFPCILGHFINNLFATIIMLM